MNVNMNLNCLSLCVSLCLSLFVFVSVFRMLYPVRMGSRCLIGGNQCLLWPHRAGRQWRGIGKALHPVGLSADISSLFCPICVLGILCFRVLVLLCLCVLLLSV